MASESLHLRVADSLGRRVAGYELPAGSVVSLAELEKEYGISRTVAREAMRLLESLGMLEARRRVGLIVTDESQWNVLSPQVIEWRLAGAGRDAQLRSLLDLRIAVEPMAARGAALHASPDDRQRLVDLARRLRELGEQGLGETDEYLMTDVAFHETLLHVSGNEMLAALDQVVRSVLVGRTRLGLSPAVPVAEVIDYHETTARAIVERMPEAAELYSRQLVVRVRAEFSLPDPPGDAGRTAP
ncbi:FadR family transcriptional regulator [Actinobacteria bacterium YIM 96077]|uniref:GntR family transcriptional regulator n=1 Tax=Phytoactinopolyspora halophila TaxID=1981511 RepID=A0A329QU36_9ACTN|nr:FCD domain-containing protein [Phytoactinopolyspora halophila]AYY15052.1 FadR family transcriptional regulator [Actinobacteria bacterium YIM 96077]RAW14228.1 GntR family transcriptional regulator [Phytoactinopolyspora halophila]